MKQILAISALILLVLGAGKLFFQTDDDISQMNDTIIQKEKIFERHLFKNHKKLQQSTNETESVPSIISYRIKHQLNSLQTPKSIGQNIEAKDIYVEAECDVQALYDEEKNTYEIAVSYSKIEKKGDDHNAAGNQDSEEENITTSRRVLQDDDVFTNQSVLETQDGELSTSEKDLGSQTVSTIQDRFFLAQVEADSGKVIKLLVEDGVQQDDHITWMTQQLVNDIMPELRKESYQQKIHEDDNLGKIAVTYDAQHISDEHLHIKKQYNQEDYIQKHIQDLHMPTINYSRNITVNKTTGVAHNGNSTFQFKMGQHQNLQQTEQDDESEEVMGHMTGHVKQDFQIIETVNAQELSKDILRYRTQASFHDVALSQEHKGSMTFGDGENIELQTAPFTTEDNIEVVPEGQDNYFAENNNNMNSTYNASLMAGDFNDNNFNLRGGNQVLYKHGHSIASMNILKNRVHVDVDYTVYSETSSVSVDTFVNNRKIISLFKVGWRNCRDHPMDKHISKQFTLFQVTYPLFGIFVVPVSAYLKLDWGWNAGLTAHTRYCQFEFNPYFKGSLMADGQLSVLKIISAGVYVSGTFLDVGLDFKLGSDNGRSYTSLQSYFTGFTLDIGFTWTKFNCFKHHRMLSEEDGFQGKRMLRHHHESRVRKVLHTIRKVVHVVKKVAKVVAHVVRNGIPGIIDTFCQRSQGYKSLLRKSTPKHTKTWFNVNIHFGL